MTCSVRATLRSGTGRLQLGRLRFVVPAAAGSSPVSHPSEVPVGGDLDRVHQLAEPLGHRVRTVMLTAELSVTAPRLSYALTRSECVPEGPLFHRYEYGADVSEPSSVAPLSR